MAVIEQRPAGLVDGRIRVFRAGFEHALDWYDTHHKTLGRKVQGSRSRNHYLVGSLVGDDFSYLAEIYYA